MRKLILLAAAVAAAAVAVAPGAQAARTVRYGIEDDAWLAFGPGTIAQRVSQQLDRLGVRVVRYTLRWDDVARRRPKRLLDPAGYNWGVADAVLRELRAHRIDVVLTLTGTPGWANGNRGANVAPHFAWMFSDFAYAAAKRYPFVRSWTIWNEPNQRRNLLPASPRTYVTRLLNPAYAAIKRASPRSTVAGGATAPRGGTGGVSPLDWIREMGRSHARLDAYAHNPYPLRPGETPSSGGCDHCTTATLATLERLTGSVHRWLGPRMRIWLTEYGYQTNPPDPFLGVPLAVQAQYVADAGLRTWQLPYVDLLIHYMLVDDAVNAANETGHWQSGLFTAAGKRKPSYYAFMLPLAQVSRRDTRTVFWGQVRPRTGSQPYRLQKQVGRRFASVGGEARTGRGGMFLRTVSARRGDRFRIWSPRDHTYSRIVTVR